MAVLEACIRKINADGYAPVYIRISQKSKPAYIKTHLSVDKKGVKGGKIKDKFILTEASVIIKSYYDKLNKVDTRNWEVKDIVDYLKNEGEISFTDFFNMKKSEMVNDSRSSSAESYQLAYNSLLNFIGKDKLMFSDIKTKVLKNWIKSLSKTARAKNLYPTLIKSIWEQGSDEYNDYDEEIIRISGNPFKNVEIPQSDIANKRAISVDDLRKLFNADTSKVVKTSKTPLSQDVMKLSFCLAAMNTADLYALKVDNLKDGVLCYNRAKTKSTRRDKAYTEIRIPDIVLPLFEKYKGENSLFKFSEIYCDAKTFNLSVNRGLKELSKIAGVDPVDTYAFRHTWATIAQNDCGASTDLIGLCLNHVPSDRVTALYIKKDFSMIDELNKKVIDFVFNSPP